MPLPFFPFSFSFLAFPLFVLDEVDVLADVANGLTKEVHELPQHTDVEVVDTFPNRCWPSEVDVVDCLVRCSAL